MKTYTVIFDLSGTLVRMRPPKLLAKKPLLSKLAQNSKLGIITSARRTETVNILSKLKAKDYFDIVLTKDDLQYKKPDKRLFEEVKRKLGTSRIIYIGDNKKDFIFAKNAKVNFCYVGKRKYGIYQNKDVNQIIRFIVKNILR